MLVESEGILACRRGDKANDGGQPGMVDRCSVKGWTRIVISTVSTGDFDLYDYDSFQISIALPF